MSHALLNYFFNVNFIVLPLEFCPVDCDWGKEMSCPGFWDPKTGEQSTPDTCMPMKDGNGCINHCPVQCGEKDMICPGKMDPAGCKMPDTCHYGSKYFSGSFI